MDIIEETLKLNNLFDKFIESVKVEGDEIIVTYLEDEDVIRNWRDYMEAKK